jgi:DnaK suppressor protein
MVVKAAKKQVKEQLKYSGISLSPEVLARLSSRLEKEERDVRASLSAITAMAVEKTFDEWQTRDEADYQLALQNRLSQIEEALMRRQQGKYGLCIECGKLIEKAKLETDPARLRCLKCQETVKTSL